MTDQDALRNLRRPTADSPLPILVSACMTGVECGFDGTANGRYPTVLKFLDYPTATLLRFCPEDYSFGTPRAMCDIYGGNGYDVLDGRARVKTTDGEDWTDGMTEAAHAMARFALANNAEVAVLMDISAACGSQVIYNGSRYAENKVYQKGPGVCAALLLRSGIPVISQRDYASLDILYSLLDPSHVSNPALIDHHQTEWYQQYFGTATTP